MSDTPKATMSEAKCETWLQAQYDTFGMVRTEDLQALLAQEAQRANERAEGLAKELEALRAPRMFPLQFQMRSEKYDKQQFREVPWPIAERAYSTYAARYGKDQSLERLAQRGGFDQREMDEFYPAWRDELSFPAQLAAATARVAEMQDRMVAAFGEGTTADQLVAISHEHEARVAELEKQLTDKLEAVTVSARVEKAEARADAAEAELARLRALPNGLDVKKIARRLALKILNLHNRGEADLQTEEDWIAAAFEEAVKTSAAPLLSAQQVGAAPVDISLGECSAWTAPAPQATPAQPAGHNPEGVEAREKILEEAAQHYARPEFDDINVRCRHVAQFLRRLARGPIPIFQPVAQPDHDRDPPAPAHPAEDPPAPAAPHEGEK